MLNYKKTIIISIKEQKLMLIEDNYKIAEYPISSSKFGLGNKTGSNMTPLGYHKINEKLGDHAHINSIYKNGKFTDKIATVNGKYNEKESVITTRIIKLEGLENNINKGGEVDSLKREIWIHGTPFENKIGTPASHGCIRMKNEDIILLYNSIEINTYLNIVIQDLTKFNTKNSLYTKRDHGFRLQDRRKKGVLDSTLWKFNNVERRKKSERRK
ncbi:MAG: L,D-transpeptidase [Candidatus Tenebribacter davisii]|nr:L,D-transpeptidase [Candidatus Tenebribacter davisii]